MSTPETPPDSGFPVSPGDRSTIEVMGKATRTKQCLTLGGAGELETPMSSGEEGLQLTGKYDPDDL